MSWACFFLPEKWELLKYPLILLHGNHCIGLCTDEALGKLQINRVSQKFYISGIMLHICFVPLVSKYCNQTNSICCYIFKPWFHGRNPCSDLLICYKNFPVIVNGNVAFYRVWSWAVSSSLMTDASLKWNQLVKWQAIACVIQASLPLWQQGSKAELWTGSCTWRDKIPQGLIVE